MAESIEIKEGFIIAHETRLANLIAKEIIHKPELSLWMILIPVIFIFYFYGLNRYKNGRRDFVKHFLFSRRLILDVAREKVESGKAPDFEDLLKKEKVPDMAIEAYRTWAKSLFELYVGLLEAEGTNYTELVKSRFEKKESYLLHLNKVNAAERQFYKALKKHMKATVDDAGDVIGKMEKSLEKLRRDEVEYLFT